MNGLEIAFQLNNEKDTEVVTALGNLTGNYFKNNENVDISWRIFHVTLDKDKYYRVLYRGKKINDLHPEIKKKIKEKFNELSKMDFNSLMNLYKKSMEDKNFAVINVKDVTEEYDLWQDPLWNYI